MTTSEFAANLIRTIVEQRNQLAGKQSIDSFIESATQQAEHILSFGLNIAVHISLVPTKCQCLHQNIQCKKGIEFEVWSICVEKAIESTGSPTIPPTFLQHAIRSQLHFSPFNAWLSDNFDGQLPKNYKCVYRISTNSNFSPSKSPTSTHSFPHCFVEKESECLKTKVEWMCKREFEELKECSELKKLKTNDNFESPPTDHTPIKDRSIEKNNTDKESLCSFTANSSNKHHPQLLLDKKKRIRRNTTGSDTSRTFYNGSPVPWTKSDTSKTPNQSTGLLCNFEESALKGRLQPINSLEGFRLQLVIQDRFNSSPIDLPMTTYFFNISDDQTPSLYLGHCSLNESGRGPIRISKNCTIQATIFNPRGSVVKIFIVPVQVNIPPNSKTFVRQRTYCMPQSLPVEEAKRSWLRYLIHFRLITDQQKRLFMHTEIKMLFSNKVDLDIQNLVSGEEFKMITSTEKPLEDETILG